MPGIEVVRNQDLEAGPPTAGMVRSQAFDLDDVWMGEARTEPGALSGWHHHGEHDTYGLVVSGTIHFEFGPDGSESVDVGPGDYFHVPAHLVHREGNPGSDRHVVALVRLGSGPTVINVDAPANG
jgi:uncharacterized RmlC-like cupin family protein